MIERERALFAAALGDMVSGPRRRRPRDRMAVRHVLSNPQLLALVHVEVAQQFPAVQTATANGDIVAALTALIEVLLENYEVIIAIIVAIIEVL